jgi:hypothetical protein
MNFGKRLFKRFLGIGGLFIYYYGDFEQGSHGAVTAKDGTDLGFSGFGSRLLPIVARQGAPDQNNGQRNGRVPNGTSKSD